MPLPKSTSATWIKENADVFNFELEPEDVARLAGMTGACGLSGLSFRALESMYSGACDFVSRPESEYQAVG